MVNEYEKTKQEIELYCRYLVSNDKPEILILEDKAQNLELVKILKSSALMMLYNLVEATIRSCITQYYDSYNKMGKSYSEASIRIKRLWLNYNAKFSKQTFNEELFKLVDQTFSDSGLFLDIDEFHLSGNADLQEIKKILEKHEIHYEDSQLKQYGGTMYAVKESRNSLAHGNISFTEAAKDLSINDIVSKYKNDVFGCLDYVVDIVEQEILSLKVR